MEIAKARANAALYALLGVLLPGAIAAGPISTTACQKCSEPVAAAFVVKAGTKLCNGRRSAGGDAGRGRRLLATTGPVCIDGRCVTDREGVLWADRRVEGRLEVGRRVGGRHVERGTSVKVPIVLREELRPVR